MASSKELVALFNAGALGKLLTQKFGGELGHTYPNKDYDFLIVFDDEDLVPEVGTVKKVVENRYGELGYPIKGEFAGDRCTTLSIVTEEVIAAITITTHYPFDGKHASLRVTSILM